MLKSADSDPNLSESKFRIRKKEPANSDSSNIHPTCILEIFFSKHQNSCLSKAKDLLVKTPKINDLESFRYFRSEKTYQIGMPFFDITLRK